jgi:hypothetical protein
MNKHVALALAVVFGLAAGGCDDDDDLEDVIDDRLDDLDIDDDLVVTRSEWNDGFVLFDDDDDLLLAFDEFRFNGALFDLADLNGDGFVTGDEWEDTLDIIDTDDNDRIEESELAVYF